VAPLSSSTVAFVAAVFGLVSSIVSFLSDWQRVLKKKWKSQEETSATNRLMDGDGRREKEREREWEILLYLFHYLGSKSGMEEYGVSMAFVQLYSLSIGFLICQGLSYLFHL